MLNKLIIAEVVSFRILSVILQLVYLKIYSNYLSIYELGLYYLFITISYSFNAFILVPLDYFQQSKLHYLKENKKSLISFLPINLNVFKISLIGFLVIEIVIFYYDKELLIDICLMFIFALLTYSAILIRGFLNNLEYRRNAIYTLFIENLLKIFLFILLIRFFSSSATLLLFSSVITMFISNIILYILIRRKKEYRIHNNTEFSFNEIFYFSYPISIGAIVNWIQLQGYRMILAPLGYVEMIGIYATVANVGNAGMNAASTVYAQLFVPNLYKTHGEFISKYIKLAFLLISFVFLVGMTFSKELVELLTNEEFAKYSPLIGYGIVAEAGNFIIGGLSIYLTIHNFTKKTLLSTWIGLTLFILSFIIIYISDLISVSTIGLPIIISQIGVAIYLLYFVFYKIKRIKNV